MLRRRALLLACVLAFSGAAGACTDDSGDGAASSSTTGPCDRSPIHEVRLTLPPDFERTPVPGFGGGGADLTEHCALHFVSPDRMGGYIEIVAGEPPERLTAPRPAGNYRWGAVHEGLMAVRTMPADVFVRAYGVDEAEFERMLTP